MNLYPPGARIAGRYEVAGRPLLGGMGIVYLCKDVEEDCPVAVKTFRPEYLPDRATRDRFLREGTHWVDLGAHPHIVRCYRVLRIDPEVYLVLELVAKEQGRRDASLRSWLIPGQPLGVETALLFALQIARGMAHAAATIPGFVHRDLKPENVLVGADRLPGASVNRLRVTDFGLAAVLEGREQGSMTRNQNTSASDQGSQVTDPLRRTQLTRGVVGTPAYMAPEQWQGEPVGVYTDVYALGCILVEMLTGQQAVEGDSLRALERAHCAGAHPALPVGVPEGVRALVGRWLAVDGGAREANWEEVEGVLAAACAGVSGRPAPAAEGAGALSREERVAAGWSYSAMGMSYLDIGKAEVATGYFERALGVGQAEGERQLEGAALGNLGLANARLGNVRLAVGLYEQALEIWRKLGVRRDESMDLGNLGSAYLLLGDARRAIGHYEQQLVITREIGNRDGEGMVLGNLGNVYLQLGDARRAIAYYERALVIWHALGVRRDESMDLGNLGSVYLRLGDARRAIAYYEQALAIHREIGDRRGEGNMLGSLGIAYADLGDVRRAIGYHEQALAIHREIGDRRGEGNALGNLGSAYKNLGDARRAVGYYEQQLVITREIGDRHGEGNALGGLGNAYLQLGDARQAIVYYEEQLIIIREIGDRHGEGNALGNLGNAYARLGVAQRAIGYYEQALVIRREIGDSNGMATDSFNMALLHAQQGETARALPLAQEAARIWTQIGHAQYAQRAQALVVQLQGSGPIDSGPTPAEILAKLGPLIEAVVAAAGGHAQARAQVEGLFDTLTQNGWRIVEPICRVWAGERDAAALTAGIDTNSALVVREILKRL